MSEQQSQPSRAAVVCPEPPAAEAGREILDAGGNAIDAIVATGFAQAVAAPFQTGIGGTAKIHYSPRGNGRTVILNATVAIGSRPVPREWAEELEGRAETIGRYQLNSRANSVGYWSIMVPGFVRGCWTAFQKYGSGRLGWADLLAPAIRLAADGVRLEPGLARFWKESEPQAGYPPLTRQLHTTPEAERIYLKPDGSPYVEGDLFVNPDLAQTLRRLAEAGGSDFYTGEIGARIAADLDAHGSTVTQQDLAAYETQEVAPIEGEFRGLRIVTTPSPTMGPVLLAMLAMIEQGNLRALGHNSPAYIDTLARVQRAAFADGVRLKGVQPGSGPQAFDAQAVQDRARSWIERIGRGERLVVRRGAVVDEGTTHATAVDAEGNVACFTHSVGTGAGSGVVTPGLGFLYNNFLGHYNPVPGFPDSIEPGKRQGGGPPTIVFKGDVPVLGIGAPGGSRLLTSMVQVIANIFDHGMSVQEAVSAPRFHSEEEQILFLEPEFPARTETELTALGNEVRRSRYMSRVQTIRLADDGTLDTGADPRGGAVRVSHHAPRS